MRRGEHSCKTVASEEWAPQPTIEFCSRSFSVCPPSSTPSLFYRKLYVMCGYSVNNLGKPNSPAEDRWFPVQSGDTLPEGKRGACPSLCQAVRLSAGLVSSSPAGDSIWQCGYRKSMYSVKLCNLSEPHALQNCPKDLTQ